MSDWLHIRQPNDYTCGPAVVAIVTGCPLDALVAELHPTPKGGTPHRRLIRALKSRGIPCGDRFVSVRGKPLPNAAIVRITYPNKKGHVVAKLGREWFDPLLPHAFTGWPPGYATGTIEWSNGGRITSSLWLMDGMP